MSFLVTFADGPAATDNRRALQLQRAPNYLRAVVGIDGRIDALDQLDDLPNLGDQVFVYALTERIHNAMHVSVIPRTKSYWLGVATYRHMADVDAQALGLDDTDTWRRYTMGLPADPREAVPA